MNRLDELREQIDACRAGSDDLSLPELAGLAQSLEEGDSVAAELDRAHRFDRSVISALHDVPVPEGLLQRLLEKAAANQSPAPAADSTHMPSVSSAVDLALESASESPAAEPIGLASPETRRSWLWKIGSLSAAAAAAGIVAVIVTFPPRRTITQDQLAAELPQWLSDAASPGAVWKPASPPPPDFPKDRAVWPPVVRWRSFRTPAGESAVVYDVTPPGTLGRVLLFVVSPRNKYAVHGTPGIALTGMTGGLRASAWQRASNQPLYVLVVDPDGDRGNDPKFYLQQRPVG